MANNWVAAWGEWLEKSTQTNIRFFKELTTAYTDLLKQDQQKERAPEEWGKMLSHLAEPYFTFYREHTENWMNWGRKFSAEVQKETDKFEEAIIEKSAPETPTSRAMPPQSPLLKLSGKPGETIKTSFRLNRGNALVQKGTFISSHFVKLENEAITKLEPKFEPSSFDLSAGETIVVQISIKIFKNAQAGWYKSQVKVEGVENAGFDILLEINALD